MFLIIAIVIALLAALVVVGGAVLGILLGFKRSLAALIAIVFSAIDSLILTFLLITPSSGVVRWLIGLVADGVGSLNATAGEILAVDAVVNAIAYYFAMITAPIFFLAVFAVLALIFVALFMLISSFIPVLRKKPGKKKRKKIVVDEFGESVEVEIKYSRVKYCSGVLYHLGGVFVGAICGLLVMSLCLFPITGSLEIVEGAVDKVPTEALDSLGVGDTVSSLPVPVQDDFNYMSLYDYVGCGIVYDLFTSTYVGNERVTLSNEMDVIGDVAASVLKLDLNFKKFNESHVEAARDVVETLDRSALLRETISGILAVAAEEDGIINADVIGSNKILTPVIEELLNVASTSNKDTIIADLTTIVDVLDILVESEVINNTSNYKLMLEKFGDGVVARLLIAVNSNERMRPVADEITMLSIRALAAELGVPADSAERYDLLMKEIAYVLNSTKGLGEADRLNSVTNELEEVFANYGIELKEAALEHVAKGLLADIGNKNTVSASDVTEFFAIYDLAVTEANGHVSSGSSVENLSHNSGKFVFTDDGKIMLNGKVFENYNAKNYRSSTAYKMGQDGVDIGDASTLCSADDMRSALLTVQDVLDNMGRYGDCEDAIAESEKVGDIFSAMVDMLVDIDFSNFDASSLIGGMGHVLDMMKGSEIFGGSSAGDILTMVLQSETIVDTLGLSRKDMTDFADKINNFASNKENGYEEATNTVANTINTITQVTDKYATEADKNQAASDMINSITKENSEIITSLVTKDMVGNFSSSVENADSVSNSLKNLINNMADYKEGNPNDASIGKEAEAVTLILSLAMTGSESGAMFDRTDEYGNVIESGSVASNADDFIATIVESTVVMNTVKQAVADNDGNSNPYGINYDTEEEKQDVAEALERYYVENGKSKELADSLNDLAKVMDVEIDLSQYRQ